MKPGRQRLPDMCPYLGWQWESMRNVCGMSAQDVMRVWKERREAAQAAGYWPQQVSAQRRMSTWLGSGIDNPFQSEEAFRLRLGMALRRLR